MLDSKTIKQQKNKEVNQKSPQNKIHSNPADTGPESVSICVAHLHLQLKQALPLQELA